MKKGTNGQSAEIQLNRPPLSLIQAAAFLEKKEGTQDRQQPGTETETDCPLVYLMELLLQSTVNKIQMAKSGVRHFLAKILHETL